MKSCVDCKRQYRPTGNYQIRCSRCKKPHIKKYIKKYVEENKEKINARFRGAYARSRRKKFPEKAQARDILNNAIKKGIIVKKQCAKCGSKKRIHGHHKDYSKPLKVVWLCPLHHKKLHTK